MTKEMTLEECLASASRLEALQDAKIAGTRPEKVFNDAIQLICKNLSVHCAAISLVSHDRQYFKACAGLPEDLQLERESDLKYSTCKHVVHLDGILSVDDMTKNPLLSDSPAVKELNIMAYLGAPIRVDGEVLGSVCAFDYEVRRWRDSDREFIQIMADYAANEIKLRKQLKELSQSEG